MTTRYTVETLASGQPRAYADSELHVRVTLEHHDPLTKPEAKVFIPWYVTEETIKQILPGLRCGYYAITREQTMHGLEPYLTWLKPMDPKKQSEVHKWSQADTRVASIWEFHVTSPFTD